MVNIVSRQRQLTGTTAEWAANDIVVGKGEIALEQQESGDVGIKVGDGTKVFSALPYWVSPPVAEEIEIADAEPTMDFGTARIVRLTGTPVQKQLIRINASPIAGETGRLVTVFNNTSEPIMFDNGTAIKLRLKDRQAAVVGVGLVAIMWLDYTLSFSTTAFVFGISGRSNALRIAWNATTVTLDYSRADYWVSESVRGNLTFVAPTDYMSRGSPLTISLTQDPVGGWTATWPEEIRVSTAFDPTPGATTTWQFIYTDEFWTEMGSGVTYE